MEDLAADCSGALRILDAVYHDSLEEGRKLVTAVKWGLHAEVCNGFYAGLPLDELAEAYARAMETLEHHQQHAAIGCTVEQLRSSFGDYNKAHETGDDKFGKKYYHNMPMKFDAWAMIYLPSYSTMERRG